MICVYGADKDDCMSSAIFAYEAMSAPSTPATPALAPAPAAPAPGFGSFAPAKGAGQGQGQFSTRGANPKPNPNLDDASEWSIKRCEDLAVSHGFDEEEPFFGLAMQVREPAGSIPRANRNYQPMSEFYNLKI